MRNECDRCGQPWIVGGKGYTHSFWGGGEGEHYHNDCSFEAARDHAAEVEIAVDAAWDVWHELNGYLGETMTPEGDAVPGDGYIYRALESIRRITAMPIRAEEKTSS